VLTALLGALLLTQAAPAMQHLIAPGSTWDDVAGKVQPGDQIILMPGRHTATTLIDLVGQRDLWIVIRSADPDEPAVIDGWHQGIRLVRPRYVKIENVIITGASVYGIAIDAQETMFAVADGELNRQLWDCHVKLENVVIRNTGPVGQRHALSCLGVDHVEIDKCRFEGWGGAAIELYGCRNIVVTDCLFRGLPDYSQKFGIRMRAGSSLVLIDRCTFENAGTRVISIGGVTHPDQFIPPLPADAPESGYEASRVRVRRNRIIGGDVIVTFDHCGQSTVRNNTIVQPRICVLSLLDTPPQSQTATPLASTHNATFAYNIVTWGPGGLTRFAHESATVAHEGINLESNLWWSSEFSPTQANPVDLPWQTDKNPQITNVDPALDGQLRPTNDDALLYGIDGP
jgi:hypothetical protein